VKCQLPPPNSRLNQLIVRPEIDGLGIIVVLDTVVESSQVRPITLLSAWTLYFDRRISGTYIIVGSLIPEILINDRQTDLGPPSPS